MKVYKCNGVRLIAVPEDNGLCFGCYFHDMAKGCQKKMEYRLPSCEEDFKSPIIYKHEKPTLSNHEL